MLIVPGLVALNDPEQDGGALLPSDQQSACDLGAIDSCRHSAGQSAEALERMIKHEVV